MAGRGSYAHLFLKLANEPNSAYFYDLNTKISYDFDAKNSVFFSGYFGRDVFEISDSFNNNYGNATINLRWNHLFSDRLFSNLSLIYTDYNYKLSINSVGFDWISKINNYNLKYDMTYYANDKIKMFFLGIFQFSCIKSAQANAVPPVAIRSSMITTLPIIGESSCKCNSSSPYSNVYALLTVGLGNLPDLRANTSGKSKSNAIGDPKINPLLSIPTILWHLNSIHAVVNAMIASLNAVVSSNSPVISLNFTPNLGKSSTVLIDRFMLLPEIFFWTLHNSIHLHVVHTNYTFIEKFVIILK